MKFIISLLLLASSSLAFGKIEFDLDKICSEISENGQITTKSGTSELAESQLLAVDQGFCDVYLETTVDDTAVEVVSVLSDIEGEEKNQVIDGPNENVDCDQDQAAKAMPLGINVDPVDDVVLIDDIRPKKRWVIRFYASHSFTTYFNSDIKLRSSRYNVDIKDYEWAERGSREFFTSHWKDGQFYRMLDEPSNTFTVSISNGRVEYFLSMFHPKFLQGDNTAKYMRGTIDGTPVDGIYPVNRPFDGYNQEPGEMELVRNQNTHLQLYFKAGVGYRIPLINTKAFNLTTVPSIAAGMMGGQNLTVSVKEGEWWEFDDHLAPKWSVQGFGGTVANRIEMNLGKKRRVGFFYETAFSYVKQKHEFMQMEDGSPGTQEYNLKFLENSVGITIKLFDTKNRR